jgi:serine/threonine-protein kinase HipA
MKLHDGFDDIGKRMLLAWADGVRGLRDERTYSAAGWAPGAAFAGLCAPAQLKTETNKVGRSPLLGKR